jgi:hypothetical protein
MEELNLFGQKTVNGVPMETIELVFEHWKSTFNKRSSTILDEARQKKLSAAIKAYGVESCKKAIEGCSMSPWHTGQNPGNKKYTDLTLIFRNAAKVEMFLDIYEQESKAHDDMEDWLNS